MPSTYSPNLRIELMASGEQGNTWGNTTNNNLGTLIEQAISGYRSLDTGWSGDAITLTALNGANDQARNMFLEVPPGVSLSADGTITAPAKPKVYAIRNMSSGGKAVIITTGTGTTATIPNGRTKIVMCDGTNFYEAVTSAADFYIANTPTTDLQATNKKFVDDADALRLKRDGTQNMTGELILSSGGTPSNSLAAVSKQYVTATFLPLAGGTITGGYLSLNYTPTLGAHAVNKTYVDGISVTPGNAGIGISGSVATGVTISLNPPSGSAIGGVKAGSGVTIAVDGTISASAGPTGVTSVSVTTANGFAGSSSGGTTPALTLSTTASGILKGSGGALAAAGQADIISTLGYTPYNAASISSASVANAGYASNAGNAYSLNGYDENDFVLISGDTMTGNLNFSSGFTTNQTVVGVFTDGTGSYFPGIAAYRNATGTNYAPFVIVQNNNSGAVVKYNLTTAGQHNFIGNVAVTGNLSATGTKPFCIDHPILPDTKLYHVAVEAPRNDLLYRGTAALSAGQAEIDIDLESRLTAGTFVALTQNAEVVGLHNKSGFGAVRASEIVDGQFTIYAEDPLSTDTITWVVMAERNDPNMHGNTLCDEDGRLVPEQPILPE